MLNPVGVLRHVAVGVSVAAAPVLVAMGVLGGGTHPERFDAKQVVVSPAGDGVRIREVVDQDFGYHERRGHRRVIPDDFGVPVDIRASSPTAPDDLWVYPLFGGTEIRIGDPDRTVTGQHRYVLEFTLPEAGLSQGELALDIIGTDEEFETGRFEVLLDGFELDDPRCNVGSPGDVGGCELERVGELYRVVFEPLEPGQGITVGGRIVRTFDPVVVDDPPLPARREGHTLPLSIGAAALGAGAAAGVFAVARNRGRNRVSAGGVADAAYGADNGPYSLVTDAALADMATTEFAPPEIAPWEARVLLTERIDDDSVGAWFAGHVGTGVLDLEAGPPPVLRPGPDFEEADQASGAPLRALFRSTDDLTLDVYRPALGAAWKSVRSLQVKAAKKSGWWHRYPPGTQASYPVAVLVPAGLCAVAVGIGWWSGLFRSVPMALAFAVGLPAIAAMAAYRVLLPSRSASGSALALRAESFRAFLLASEGQHVEWAWSRGLLREYTAWAVALGAADAWGNAVQRSSVPPAEAAALTAPLVIHAQRGSVHSAHTKPGESGGSGGSGGGWSSGGFSSGSVGGGGGGGSSGSW